MNSERSRLVNPAIPISGRTTLRRPRLIYFIAVLGLIALGLLSRRYPHLLPTSLGKYPGDALWALMVFLGLGFWFRRASTIALALTAFAFSTGIELFQLYRAPWIDSFRATIPGRLILGSGFSWTDILAYAVGISFGVAVECIAFRPSKMKTPAPCEAGVI